jgi:hypothetical protein
MHGLGREARRAGVAEETWSGLSGRQAGAAHAERWRGQQWGWRLPLETLDGRRVGAAHAGRWRRLRWGRRSPPMEASGRGSARKEMERA